MTDLPVIPEGTPAALKILIWTSVGVAAWVTIWQKLKIPTWMRIIVKELTPDSGGSVKDLVAKSTEDTSKNLVLTQKIARRQLRQHRRMKTLEENVAGIKGDVSGVKDDVTGIKEEQQRLKVEHGDFEKRFARFIVHEARGDLQAAKLVEEERRLLAAMTEEDQRKLDEEPLPPKADRP